FLSLHRLCILLPCVILMGLLNERYVSTAKNIFHSVSEWPMPYIKIATQQNNAGQQNAQPVQRQEQLQNGRKNKTREYVQNETQYDIDWKSYLKIAGIALIAILALCVLIFFSYSIGYYKGKMTDESKKISKNDIQKIDELIDETGNNYRLILSKLAAIEEKINDENGQHVDNIMDAAEGAQRRAASELSGKDRKDIKKNKSSAE
ncbi:hypothetical protein VU05_03310, partial [Desulfobulbus sp. F1]|nr:hypothetical protein [Desulfobulbus sp. F1]